jgi:hypothetical protein
MGKHIKVDGAWACVDCNAKLPVAQWAGRLRRPLTRCEVCGPYRRLTMKWLSGRSTAAAMVSSAIRSGALAKASQYRCTDCDAPANCYDHRDYGRPLDVEPVCRSCNSRRGSAEPLNQYIVGLVLAAAAQPA